MPKNCDNQAKNGTPTEMVYKDRSSEDLFSNTSVFLTMLVNWPELHVVANLVGFKSNTNLNRGDASLFYWRRKSNCIVFFSDTVFINDS